MIVYPWKVEEKTRDTHKKDKVKPGGEKKSKKSRDKYNLEKLGESPNPNINFLTDTYLFSLEMT